MKVTIGSLFDMLVTVTCPHLLFNNKNNNNERKRNDLSLESDDRADDDYSRKK